MVARRRRLADTLLLNWIVTLSLLLILVGLVTFLVFLTSPGDRWTEAGRLVGATLFQVGAVTLLLELVHLERLVGTKVPEALLEGGYLEHLKEDRLDDLIERVIRARFHGLSGEDLRLGRDWLFQSLSAPSRRDYTVTLELKRDEPIVEPPSPTSHPHDGAQPTARPGPPVAGPAIRAAARGARRGRSAPPAAGRPRRPPGGGCAGGPSRRRPRPGPSRGRPSRRRRS